VSLTTRAAAYAVPASAAINPYLVPSGCWCSASNQMHASMGQMDEWTPDRYINPALHTTRAVTITQLMFQAFILVYQQNYKKYTLVVFAIT